MTGDTWRQELARRDTLHRQDDLQEMVAALPWAQREQLRGWLMLHQDPQAVEDAPAMEAARREIDALLPWIRPDGLRCLVRVARAMAEKR